MSATDTESRHRRARRERRALVGTRPFDPRDVPAIAAGRWWHAAFATGLGTVDFAVPEGNGGAGWSMLQATVANQPTALTENGSAQFRMRRQADAAPSRIATGNVQAGWTGPTYAAGWFRFPDASADITGNGTLFTHTLATGNQRRLFWSAIATNDSLNLNPSTDGTNGVVGPAGARSVRVANYFTGLGWVYVEGFIDPAFQLGGSTIADKVKQARDLTLLSTTTTTPDVDITQIFDGLAPAFIGCVSASASNADTTDWSAVYYGNGIPSLAERRALAGYRAPLSAAFLAAA